jgi:ligand-binding SRPBCC domain-containing protein
VARIEVRTEISAPIETVFDLARSIDAHVESMGRSRERAVAGVTTGLIGLGDHVTWRATHFGIPFTMTSAIVEMESPTYFVDQQTRGPFRRFHHEHRFSASGDGTVMTDSLEFSSPFGPLGRAVDRLGLARYLTKLIHERNRHLKTAAEKPVRGP